MGLWYAERGLRTVKKRKKEDTTNKELQGHPQGSALQLPGWFGLGDVLHVHAH